jgi:hypothetical protein
VDSPAAGLILKSNPDLKQAIESKFWHSLKKPERMSLFSLSDTDYEKVSKHIHNKEKQYNKKPASKKGALILLEGEDFKIEDPSSVEFLKSLFKPD